MKKSLTILSLTLSSVASAAAQVGANVNISIGQGAAAGGQVNSGALVSLVQMISTLIGMLVPVAVALAVLCFFWFLIKFITSEEEGDKKRKALGGIGYSILALFIMVSIWGIVGFLGNILGIGQGGSVPIPSVPVLNNNPIGGIGNILD
jgi:hypothetical protein